MKIMKNVVKNIEEWMIKRKLIFRHFGKLLSLENQSSAVAKKLFVPLLRREIEKKNEKKAKWESLKEINEA